MYTCFSQITDRNEIMHYKLAIYLHEKIINKS